MILTGDEILKEMHAGNISIEPYDSARLNPNSYNLCLHPTLHMLADDVLDMKKKCGTKEIIIPESGFRLEPGHLYLGRTVEFTKSLKHVPLLEGRSSIGRLGISIHATAGFGDVGFCGFWTLEISVVQPVIIYPLIEICQIYYTEVKGKLMEYKGKYQNNQGIQVSQIFNEL
jgi:dCTP deaminase